MHHDVGVCWIGDRELRAALPLRYEREHAGQPAARWWNGRGPLVSPGVRDHRIPATVREPGGARSRRLSEALPLREA
jgi:hypothetical protein